MSCSASTLEKKFNFKKIECLQVKFSCPLTETAIKQISFTNPSDHSVGFLIVFFGNSHEFFRTVPPQPIVRLNSRKTIVVNVEYYARKIKKTRGNCLTFIKYKGCQIYTHRTKRKIYFNSLLLRRSTLSSKTNLFFYLLFARIVYNNFCRNTRRLIIVYKCFYRYVLLSVPAYLLFCGSTIGPYFGRNQTFLLEGQADKLAISSEYTISSGLYQTVDKTLTITVPYRNAAEYEIWMSEQRPNQARKFSHIIQVVQPKTVHPNVPFSLYFYTILM